MDALKFLNTSETIMRAFTEKYIHLIFAIYTLIAFTGYIDIRTMMAELVKGQAVLTKEYDAHVSMDENRYRELVSVKEEQIKRQNVIDFVKSYREQNNWSMFNRKHTTQTAGE